MSAPAFVTVPVIVCDRMSDPNGPIETVGSAPATGELTVTSGSGIPSVVAVKVLESP